MNPLLSASKFSQVAALLLSVVSSPHTLTITAQLGEEITSLLRAAQFEFSAGDVLEARLSLRKLTLLLYTRRKICISLVAMYFLDVNEEM